MNLFKTLLPIYILCFATLQAEEFRIAVSDLIASSIQAPLEAHADQNEFTLVIESIGSLPALDKLRSDEVDLAIVALPDDNRSPRGEFIVSPFAYDASMVVVKQSNPIQEISMKELGGIFGSRQELSVNTWGDLGFSGLGSRNIYPCLGISENSITLELFRHYVLNGTSLNSNVSIEQVDNVEDLIISNGSAIALMPRLPKKSGLKTLMISRDDDSPAFGPTSNNVHHGDYPIRLPFCIAYNQRDKSKLVSLIRYLIEDEMASYLESNGLFSLSNNVRRNLVMELELE